MGANVTQKLIASHLVTGEMAPGTEVGLPIDQTLTQDATGMLVVLELEAMGLDRARTQLSVQDVDHDLINNVTRGPTIRGSHALSSRQVGVLLCGGLINCVRGRLVGPTGSTSGG